MRRTSKIIRLKKNLLKRYRFLFFYKNNKKNIVNYGSFLKKFDFFFNFFFFFKPNMFFFDNYVNVYYFSFKKKAQYLMSSYFFYNYLNDKDIKNIFYNFTNSNFIITLPDRGNKKILEVAAGFETQLKFKKFFFLYKFFLFGNGYFNKDPAIVNTDLEPINFILNFLKFCIIFYQIVVVSVLGILINI